MTAGVSGVVVAVALAGWAAHHTLRLSNEPRSLAGPVGIMHRGGPVGQAPSGRGGSSASAKPLPPDVLYARTSPAVVRVNVHGAAMKPMGHGTGFFVSPDGLLITNYHVIDGANYATVERADGVVLRVEGIVAMDEASDLVLVKATPAGDVLPTLPLGPDTPPHVGTKVYAIGHPHGLKNVLSEGLVSSLGDPARGHDFIQTTAAISPGSSGGPLMTADGVVVGVTTATVRDAQNLNFAMPASRVRALLEQPRDEKPRRLADVTMRGAKRGGAARGATSDSDRPGPGGLPAARPPVDRAVDRVWDALRRDDLDEAETLVDTLRERGARSAYYWFTAGCVHAKLNRDDLAVFAFNMSLALKPDKAATHLNLGAAHARQGKLREAVAAYEAAAKLEPGDARPYAQAGDAYVRHNQPGHAVPFFKRALALEPENASHHRDLGVAHAAMNRHAEALAFLRKAADLEPENGDHHRNLGIALSELRRYGEALECLQRAVALKPDGAEAYLYLGYAHRYLGNHAGAMDAWKNADRFDSPTGKSGQLARQAMSQYARRGELALPGRK